MADKFESKTIAGLGSLGGGAKRMFETLTGSASKGGSGVIGAGKKIGGVADSTVGTVLEKTGNFGKDHPAIALIALAALAWKPVKNFFGHRKAKKENTALQAEAGQLTIAEQNMLRRQQAATTSANLGQFNPADGNALARVQAGRGVGAPNLPS